MTSMSEIICPCCGGASPAEAFYCMVCAEPIRCKKCCTAILANARACIKCGTLIPGRDADERHIAGSGLMLPPGYNRLTVHEKDQTYSYDADFVFSDTFGQQAATGGVIAHLGGFGARAPASRPVTQYAGQPSGVVEVDEQRSSLPQLASGPNNANNGSSVPARVTDSPTTPERAVRAVFSEHDGKLTLQVSDMKALNQ
jgi:hypothetical protein